MSGWGQAHINNTIGFGQGSTNNSVNWGSSYGNSFSGDTALASGGGFTGLLNEYPGAAAAYSLRQLSSSYTSSAIRVRRSSDNSEQDIGFVSNELDTASLLSFVSGGDGFVTTWYDQSGNGNNVTQANASNQLQIVNAGVLNTNNGKPAIRKITTQFMSLGGSLTLNPLYSFSVYQKGVGTPSNVGIWGQLAGVSNYALLSRFFTGSRQLGFINVNGGRVDYSSSYVLSEVSQNLITASVVNGIKLRVNNTNVGTFGTQTSTSIGGQFCLMGYTNAATESDPNSYWQEFIFYSSDQSTNELAIETNINNYYSIY